MSGYRGGFGTGPLHILDATPVEIVEGHGPLRLGDFTIGGGLVLWVRRLELTWRLDYERAWTLEVRIVTRLPDRFDPNLAVDVSFSRNHGLFLDENGEARPARTDETSATWVARRVYETLLWLVQHEVAESVRVGNEFVVDIHAEERRYLGA